LKLKPITLKLVKEVQCSKCKKHNPIPRAMRARGAEGPDGSVHPASASASAIWFECAGCGKRLHVKKQLAGKKVKCRGCGKTTQVPAAPAKEEASPTGETGTAGDKEKDAPQGSDPKEEPRGQESA
jgi:DNA-directed RNA polymerase subunit M/transcription elongation factor TFIIS